ncbi:HlyD family type I secretion periplasmic adaptor subunit [Ancylobacter sonchi]|uniref:HlyD family type I secretion periplasmic adaptor subunit n=1 Tax=Ancylobacter sonchi TaxID=1937790 RepID=UPI001BD657BD|nr:HlyD family type I secretion periplasmic adaptor subunit [Ancylobacter sonchi]MBS7533754.1 HlyD family type I secretion periplasmic adaptor subunit [Ancylobacter sonchi]
MNAPLNRRAAGDAVAKYLPDALALEQRRIPLPARTGALIIVLLVAAFAVWASVAQINRIVVANGQLFASEPLAVVQPLESAVVRTILVRAGDWVSAGQTVVQLDTTFVGADQNALEERQHGLEAEVARLHAELGGQPFSDPSGEPNRATQVRLHTERQAEYAANLANFDEEIRRIEAKLDTNRASLAAIDGRVKLLHDMEDIRAKSYEGNYTSRFQLLQAQADTLSAITQRDTLRGEQQELEHELAASRAKRMAFVKEWRRRAEEQLVEADRTLDAVNEEATKARRKMSLSALTSPVDGVVMEVAKRSVGSVLQSAEPLVTIVPSNTPLEAEVEIDAADRGMVRVGDTVRVKLDAFPFQRHGMLNGTLKVVSPDAVKREPMQGGGSYFRARVVLNPASVERFANGGLGLSPGMTARAEIDAGQQTVISYVIYPIMRVMDEGMREPR